jgi:hypothetical protein
MSYKFDRDRVSSILLTEGNEGWAITACMPVPIYIQSDVRRMHDFNYFHESVFTHENLRELISAVRSYRGTQAS